MLIVDEETTDASIEDMKKFIAGLLDKRPKHHLDFIRNKGVYMTEHEKMIWRKNYYANKNKEDVELLKAETNRLISNLKQERPDLYPNQESI